MNVKFIKTDDGRVIGTQLTLLVGETLILSKALSEYMESPDCPDVVATRIMLEQYHDAVADMKGGAE